MKKMILLKNALIALSAIALCSCSRAVSGPDKTLAGAALGAGWGAGAGAIVGNQTNHAGEGTAVGAGIGLVEGAMTGMMGDVVESQTIRQANELQSLRVQNKANSQDLMRLQARLDESVSTALPGGVYQVFFDPDETNLKSGAIANLEVIANALQSSSSAHKIIVNGHTDDSGTPSYNDRLAQARARNVASYLMAKGLSADQVVVESFGADRPMASNTTELGRHFNRRVDIYVAN